jgi:cell division protein FtsI/penicillin-binding protein 2
VAWSLPLATPSFDPNLFVAGISGKDYGALRDSPDLPLLNRIIAGEYPPGSTIKPLLVLAGLDGGLSRLSIKSTTLASSSCRDKHANSATGKKAVTVAASMPIWRLRSPATSTFTSSLTAWA